MNSNTLARENSTLYLSSKSVMLKKLCQFYVWNLKGESKCSNEKVMLEVITKPPKLLKIIINGSPSSIPRSSGKCQNLNCIFQWGAENKNLFISRSHWFSLATPSSSKCLKYQEIVFSPTPWLLIHHMHRCLHNQHCLL